MTGAASYTITFAMDDLPPVTEFWELPLYDESGYFVDNEIDRYSIVHEGGGDIRGKPDGEMVFVRPDGRDHEVVRPRLRDDIRKRILGPSEPSFPGAAERHGCEPAGGGSELDKHGDGDSMKLLAT